MLRHSPSPWNLCGALPPGGHAIVKVCAHAGDLSTPIPREGTPPLHRTDSGGMHPPLPLDLPSTTPRLLVPGHAPNPSTRPTPTSPQRVFWPIITEISPDIVRALSKQGAALVVIYNGPAKLLPDLGDKASHE